MSNLCSNLVIQIVFVIIVFRYVHYRPNEESKENRLENQNIKLLGFQCSVLTHVCKRRYAWKLAKAKAQQVNLHVIPLLLVCCGDVSLNPGHVFSNTKKRTQSITTEFTRKFKPATRSIICKIIRKQEKYIESLLHENFLKKYEGEGIYPPGLKVRKSPQISNSREVNEIWKNIFDNTSMELNKALITAHSKNTKVLWEELNKERNELMGKLKSESEIKEFNLWLEEKAKIFFEQTIQRKQKKIENHKQKFQHKTLIRETSEGKESQNSLTIRTVENSSNENQDHGSTRPEIADGERPYCSKCYRVFNNRTDMNVHQKSCIKIKDGESFFRMCQFQAPKNNTDYNKNDKVLPPSQPLKEADEVEITRSQLKYSRNVNSEEKLHTSNSILNKSNSVTFESIESPQNDVPVSGDENSNIEENDERALNIASRSVTNKISPRRRKNRRTHLGHKIKEVDPSEELHDEIILNLSDYELSDAEKIVLEKGLKFVPTPNKVNKTELLKDVNRFSRIMRLKEYFADNNESGQTRNKYNKSNFTPENGRDRILDNYLCTTKEMFTNMNGIRVRPNLTQAEKNAIESLRRNSSIVIFPADKGGAIVIQNRSTYIEVVEEHLKSRGANGQPIYEQIDADISNVITEKINNAIDEAMENGVIDANTKDGLKVNNPKAGNLYCLPKIHKDPNSKRPPPRPICNSKGTPTEIISQRIDEQLQPLVKKLPSYIQDSSDFLRKIEEINETHTLPTNTLLCTWDVKSLYTNIPKEGGKEACEYFLHTNKISLYVINTIMKFIELILNCNLFRFGNSYFIQREGTAMGTRMAPSYASLFMGYLEKDILLKAVHKPLVWFRYLDDIFFIWPHGEEKHAEFLEMANRNQYGMVFETSQESISNKSVPFLDIKVILKNGKIKTDLHQKPTDKHQYLNFSSSHPYKQKANLPYTLALRIRRICSDISDFHAHCDKLTKILRARGYKLGLIKDSIRKASAISRQDALLKLEKQNEDHVIFITTYNPMLPNIKEN